MNDQLEAQVRHAAALRQAEQRRQFLMRELAAEQRELVRLQALGTTERMAAPPAGRVVSLPSAVTPSTYEARHKAAVAQARQNYAAHVARTRAAFDAAVATKMKAGATRYEALLAVSREQPALWIETRGLR